MQYRRGCIGCSFEGPILPGTLSPPIYTLDERQLTNLIGVLGAVLGFATLGLVMIFCPSIGRRKRRYMGVPKRAPRSQNTRQSQVYDIDNDEDDVNCKLQEMRSITV